MINNEMLKDLVCPIGKFELILEGDYLVCSNCGAKFPIVDDIPVLILDDAILPDGITSPEELKCMKK
jgi:uncharacterized protein